MANPESPDVINPNWVRAYLAFINQEITLAEIPAIAAQELEGAQ